MVAIIGCIVSLISAVSVAAGNPNMNDEKIYASTSPGTRYCFECTTSKRGHPAEKTQPTYVVRAASDKDGSKFLVVDEVEGEQVRCVNKLRMSKKAIFYTGVNDTDFRTPLCLLKLPYEPRQEWKTIMTWEDDLQVEIRCKNVGTEIIDVPAGKFSTIIVQARVAVGNDRIRSKTWFAEGIGPIKSIQTWGNQHYVIVLKSFTPGKQ